MVATYTFCFHFLLMNCLHLNEIQTFASALILKRHFSPSPFLSASYTGENCELGILESFN